MSKGAYTPEFTPVARPGHVIRLDDGGQFNHYRVERYTAIPQVVETITVGQNSTNTDVELTELELWDDWLGQWRLLDLANDIPTGDISVELDLGGRQAPVWATQNGRGSIDRETGAVTAWDQNASASAVEDQLTHLSELFTFEQDVPYATVENTATSGGDVDVPLTFSGFIFELEGPVQEPSEQPVQVPIENVRGR